MNADLILVNGIAVLLIALVLWWFFGSKISATTMSADAPIVVLVKDGVYQPSHIQVPAGKPIKLQFLRTDATPCSEYLIFTQLNASYRLPLQQKVEIVLPPLAAGDIDFTCQMGMYRGKILAVK